jgi:hypothetical protein
VSITASYKKPCGRDGEERRVHGELASVREIVDLSAQEALNRAQAFLAQQGYTIAQRTDTWLTAERRPQEYTAGQHVPNLTLEALPQPEGGVRIGVRGNDREGVQERQATWVEWSESLPKKLEPATSEPGDHQSTVETPEVPLPPPPRVESQVVPPPSQPSPPYPSYAPPTAQEGTRRRRWLLPVLGGCIVLPVLLIGFVGCLAVLGSVGGDIGTPKGAGSGETFTNENYADLVADPQGNRGASVDITGKIFQPPEVRGDEAAFQIWVDPKNNDWNTLVRMDPDSANVGSNDYVRVQGTVRGSFEGENPFRGTVTAVEIEADSVEEVDATEALDPAQETVRVGQTREDQGFSATVDKVEFGEETTRVYVTARNNTRNDANFFAHNARIVQGSRQVDPERSPQYDFPQPQSDLGPGVETEGVLAFGPVDPSRTFRIELEWSSREFRVRAQPLVFEVSP